ncbi:Ribosomal protein S4 and related proteins [Klebsiella pneumoniae IS53]|nr:Ribosomal protein S4 and related proteins [Klebsiella pneumoniae IS53]
MLYVVECAYTDPQSEAAWNTFYNQEKLPALVSVPGFYASQRFRALSEGLPLLTWRCTISTMLPSSTATPTAATAAAILPAGNRRSPTGIATSI